MSNIKMSRLQIVPRRNPHSLIALFGFTMILHACTKDPTKTDQLSAPEPPTFTTPVVELPLANGRAALFGIKACKVYRSDPIEASAGNWTLLFEPEPYPMPQQCVRERLEFDGEYIQIEIGTQALGAGGCCTTYAAYRSQDGENWEVRPATSITEWQSVGDADDRIPE